MEVVKLAATSPKQEITAPSLGIYQVKSHRKSLELNQSHVLASPYMQGSLAPYLSTSLATRGQENP